MDLSRSSVYHIDEEEIKRKTELISFLKHILMKEILYSFLSSAISNSVRKKSHPHFQSSNGNQVLILFLLPTVTTPY